MKLLMFIIIILLGNYSDASIDCTGRFVNSITDVCWKCLFPITIGGVKIVPSSITDSQSSKQIICFCPRPWIPAPVPGIPVGFWEPVRLVDVTKSPMCIW
ncbi:TraU protein [Hyalomma marginatum]|uniref:TraU protein n=1 Tax=Hyalomma marginatum TaxID=34627 RepID=A0A8S4BYA7_9ACAR|nr:TraU protein [Hyalomma marginatum]